MGATGGTLQRAGLQPPGAANEFPVSHPDDHTSGDDESGGSREEAEQQQGRVRMRMRLDGSSRARVRGR